MASGVVAALEAELDASELDDCELDDSELEACALELEEERLLSLSLPPPQAVKPAVSASIRIKRGDWFIAVLHNKVAASVWSLCYKSATINSPSATLIERIAIPRIWPALLHFFDLARFACA